MLGGQGVLLARGRLSSFYQVIQGNIISVHLFISGIALFFYMVFLFI